MWSGNNPDQQWGMNRMAFMNMPHEQVDWASLAQQWIKMKEEAPPTEKEEGGEAPMEITKDESTAPNSREHDWMASHGGDPSAASWGGAGWGWDQAGAWMQWAGAAPSAVPDMAATAGYSTGPGYSTVPQEHQPPVAPPAPVFPYTPPAPPSAPVDTYTRGYWTSNPPAEIVKNHHSWESSSSSRKKHSSVPVPQPEPAQELDAAKRRALPAWIREGLEKMEREKQKKAEQERLQKLKKDGAFDNLSPLNEAEGDPSGMNGGMEALRKSKFDSDSEEEELPPPSKPVTESVPATRRSRFDQSEPVLAPPILPKPKFKSKEQILQSVMTDVRKILTQLLMEVTTEEIEKAVEETHKQFKKKAPAATLRKTPALASLTGKLGLGIYESDSGSESEPEKVTNEPDSDQELRDRIDKLKNEFVRVEEDIEREALELEEKERIHLTRANQLSTIAEDSSPSGVEDQVQPSREGSAASKSEKQTLQKTNSEEARSNNGLVEDTNRDSRSKDRRSSERKNRRSSERKERRSAERKDRKSVERRDRRSSERKDRRSSERSKSDKRSESTRSSSSESSSSSSSSEDSSSPSPRRDKKNKRHHHHHHHHRKDRKRRYSRSSSRSKSRSRSRSRDRHRHSKPSKHSSSRSTYRKRSSDRKRRRSSSSSSGSSTKYRKMSRRR